MDGSNINIQNAVLTIRKTDTHKLQNVNLNLTKKITNPACQWNNTENSTKDAGNAYFVWDGLMYNFRIKECLCVSEYDAYNVVKIGVAWCYTCEFLERYHHEM